MAQVVLDQGLGLAGMSSGGGPRTRTALDSHYVALTTDLLYRDGARPSSARANNDSAPCAQQLSQNIHSNTILVSGTMRVVTAANSHGASLNATAIVVVTHH